ncbi:hypothetical protein ACOBQX_02560 [Actinokineospora sp. G85]|uniref:hypothetical protein n=1 Tax=Actinokineospora sp. G85 TaxID=3406626 RepID=UPI003C728E1D
MTFRNRLVTAAALVLLPLGTTGAIAAATAAPVSAADTLQVTDEPTDDTPWD